MVVSGVLAARILGVHDRGVFALLWVFALIIAMGTSLGLPVAVTYWVARAPAASGAMARSLLPAAAIQGTCALLVHGVVVYLVFETRETPLFALVLLPSSLALRYSPISTRTRSYKASNTSGHSACVGCFQCSFTVPRCWSCSSRI